MIPLMVRFNLSTICTFRSLCVASSLILLSVRFYKFFTKKLKNSVPFFVYVTFGRLIVSLKICPDELLLAIPRLHLSALTIQTYPP